MQTIVKAVFGPESDSIAIVFSPVLAKWDEGAFCMPLLHLLLARGYQVHVYDSLSLAQENSTLQTSFKNWDIYLRAQYPQIDLAIGQAYGGALVQSLLSGTLATCPRVLGLSAPTRASAQLQRNLKSILTALDTQGEMAALHLLDYYVKPEHSDDYQPLPSISLEESGIGQRLRTGFLQLMKTDACTQVNNYAGRILHIYGMASRLVNTDSIVLSSHHRRQISSGISGCGMRPVTEAPDIALELIANFLN
jgi:hypothetical protein